MLKFMLSLAALSFGVVAESLWNHHWYGSVAFPLMLTFLICSIPFAFPESKDRPLSP